MNSKLPYIAGLAVALIISIGADIIGAWWILHFNCLSGRYSSRNNVAARSASNIIVCLAGYMCRSLAEKLNCPPLDEKLKSDRL